MVTLAIAMLQSTLSCAPQSLNLWTHATEQIRRKLDTRAAGASKALLQSMLTAYESTTATSLVFGFCTALKKLRA